MSSSTKHEKYVEEMLHEMSVFDDMLERLNKQQKYGG